MYATDAVLLGDVFVNDVTGYLEGIAKIARTGVQQYSGVEMGRPDLSVVNVYRDADEVFSKSSLQSFSKLPLTIGHPPKGVSASNWKAVAVGTSGDEVLRDGESLKIGLKVMDAAAVKSIKDGTRQLSVGYLTEIVWGDGMAPDSTPFHARQTKITGDHIAFVPVGRAGPQYRFGDSWAEIDPSPSTQDPSMKTLVIDGNTVELSDAAVIAVGHLQKQIVTLTTDNLKLIADANQVTETGKKTIEAKDGEILKLQADHAVALQVKDAEINTMKSLVLTEDKLDAVLAERQTVFDAARPTLGATFDFKGKSAAEVRRLTVAKRLGDKAVEGRTDDHIAIAFDTLTAPALQIDPIRAVMGDGQPHATHIGDTSRAYADMRAGLENAYSPTKAA